MATMTITIPDAVAPRVLDALADRGGWDGTGNKAAFAKGVVIDYIMSVTRNREAEKDAATARDAAMAKATRDIALS